MDARSLLVTGLKHSGKSSVGRTLSRSLAVEFHDLDSEIVSLCGDVGTVRQIYRTVGREAFQALEAEAAKRLAEAPERMVIAAGGGTIDNRAAMDALVAFCFTVFLDVGVEVLVERVFHGGVPAFVDPQRPVEHFREICERRRRAYLAICDLRIDVCERSQADVAALITKHVQEKVIGW